jgi:hypothetical protein
MRLDRRLLHRRGWIGASELEQELAALPDSAGKATTLGEADDAGDASRDEAAAGTPNLS